MLFLPSYLIVWFCCCLLLAASYIVVVVPTTTTRNNNRLVVSLHPPLLREIQIEFIQRSCWRTQELDKVPASQNTTPWWAERNPRISVRLKFLLTPRLYRHLLQKEAYPIPAYLRVEPRALDAKKNLRWKKSSCHAHQSNLHTLEEEEKSVLMVCNQKVSRASVI